jgi:hypothetical protein
MRKRSPIAIFLLAGLIAGGRVFAEGEGCSNPVDALASPNWSSIRPAHLPIETFFSTRIGWSGLNHVSSKEEKVRSRYLALLPGFVPSLVQVYPFDHALARVSNRSPVFYIHASDVGRLDPDYDPAFIHMVRLTTAGDTRTVQVTRGITAFNYKPAYSKAAEVPIQAERLSPEVISLRPLHRLASGEYLITLDRAGNDGFEFGIDCR